ncbi:hypothetical protein GmHk_11G033121 [Glycine max]|nr:hypothetical protein GmHk_11G033121 [Glycine max]
MGVIGPLKLFKEQVSMWSSKSWKWLIEFSTKNGRYVSLYLHLLGWNQAIVPSLGKHNVYWIKSFGPLGP